MRTKSPTIPQLQAQLENLQATASTIKEQQEALDEQARELEAQLRLARGTRDVNPEDERSTKELYSVVVHLLKQRPMRHHEIVEAVGNNVNENRIKGVITQIRRDDIGYVNLGNERIGLHFIPDAEVLKRLRARRARG